VRPLRPHPDAWRDRLAQRRRRGLDPAVRGARPARDTRSGRAGGSRAFDVQAKADAEGDDEGGHQGGARGRSAGCRGSGGVEVEGKAEIGREGAHRGGAGDRHAGGGERCEGPEEGHQREAGQREDRHREGHEGRGQGAREQAPGEGGHQARGEDSKGLTRTRQRAWIGGNSMTPARDLTASGTPCSPHDQIRPLPVGKGPMKWTGDRRPGSGGQHLSTRFGAP